MKRKLTFENVRWSSDAEHERGMRDLDEQFSHHLAALQDKLKQREGQLKEMHEQEVPVLFYLPSFLLPPLLSSASLSLFLSQ